MNDNSTFEYKKVSSNFFLDPFLSFIALIGLILITVYFYKNMSPFYLIIGLVLFIPSSFYLVYRFYSSYTSYNHDLKKLKKKGINTIKIQSAIGITSLIVFLICLISIISGVFLFGIMEGLLNLLIPLTFIILGVFGMVGFFYTLYQRMN
jgi:hypothetical protein